LQATTVIDTALPEDGHRALLIGRVWLAHASGPCPVLCRNGELLDLSSLAATVSELLEMEDLPDRLVSARNLPSVGSLEAILHSSLYLHYASSSHRLLTPVDLQAIKACGVTFAASMLERVIEERARGDLAKAAALRAEITHVLGDELTAIQPGSAAALALKNLLIERGVWSQYLEVGIGPYAEIFTKAQPLSAVGWGSQVGIHSASQWNNPEPEIVLVVNSKAKIVGASLGNDVNLRDIEGRSALLLGKAKDNNASCAIGPFIRLFDAHFNLQDVEQAEISLYVEGEDGFTMQGLSSMRYISRKPIDLVAQTMGDFHQYPDGLALFLGTMFAPVEDRGEPGKGFSHKMGDRVSISSPRLGCLTNWVNYSENLPPWSFGMSALMRNLAERGLIKK
jgi:fumarylacetoacetate (FAA) hydrolase family protein